MKKAFTLVELLVVVVVIAILASISFRIAGIGEDTSRRNTTVSRLQRLENCLSGYYAAFGSYPPVQLSGASRNYLYEVNTDTGIQLVERNPKTTVDLSQDDGWRQVEAACRSQPVRAEFPYNAGMQDYVRTMSDTLRQLHEDGEEGYERAVLGSGFDALDNPEQLSGKYGKALWSETQVFRFGLISYLVPRYLVMMGHGSGSGGSDIYDDFDQWGDNNTKPCRFEDGVQYDSWRDLSRDLQQESEKWKVKLLPSQAVTARWLPNLEGQLSGNSMSVKVYGVELMRSGEGMKLDPNIKIYSSGNSQSQGMTQPYTLNFLTCKDGWENDLYYYSLPPYQGYRLWSAGKNGRTFMPWVTQEEIESGDLSKFQDLIRSWTADDIVHMTN